MRGQNLFTETDRVSHFHECRMLYTHWMAFVLPRFTENMALLFFIPFSILVL